MEIEDVKGSTPVVLFDTEQRYGRIAGAVSSLDERARRGVKDR